MSEAAQSFTRRLDDEDVLIKLNWDEWLHTPPPFDSTDYQVTEVVEWADATCFA